MVTTEEVGENMMEHEEIVEKIRSNPTWLVRKVAPCSRIAAPRCGLRLGLGLGLGLGSGLGFGLGSCSSSTRASGIGLPLPILKESSFAASE